MPAWQRWWKRNGIHGMIIRQSRVWDILWTERSLYSHGTNRNKKYPTNRTTIWLRNPITGHIPWENHNSEMYMHPNVHSTTIYNTQDIEAI